tara:strand:+ start:160 stop:774 length:615 start_codon:yes stop_codon:yes gene_type:complete
MSNLFLSFLIISFLFSNKTNYWNLGVSINDTSVQRIIKKDISLNNIVVEGSDIYKNNQITYTLNKNYIIAPQKKNNILDSNFEEYGDDYFSDIKTLMANNEYFEAAKKLILLDNGAANTIFQDEDDYYYCSSMIYYNLGNIDEAYFNINKVSNIDSDPKLLFLEALILQEINFEKAVFLFNDIIEKFPNNDYAEYSKNILKDNR